TNTTCLGWSSLFINVLQGQGLLNKGGFNWDFTKVMMNNPEIETIDVTVLNGKLFRGRLPDGTENTVKTQVNGFLVGKGLWEGFNTTANSKNMDWPWQMPLTIRPVETGGAALMPFHVGLPLGWEYSFGLG